MTTIIEKKISNKTLTQGILILHLIIILFILLIGYIIFRNDFFYFKNHFRNYLMSTKLLYIGAFFTILLISIVIHELIHGYFFARYNHSGWKSVKFGFNIKMLAPYATCQEPVKVKHFRIIVAMPTIILGIIPLLISLSIYHNLLLFFYAAFMILSGIGDILVLWVVRKLDANQYIIDHPRTLGYFLINNYQVDELPEIQKQIHKPEHQSKKEKKSNSKKLLWIFIITFLFVFIIKLIMKRF